MRKADIIVPIDIANQIRGAHIWVEEQLIALVFGDNRIGRIVPATAIKSHPTDGTSRHMRDINELLDVFRCLNSYAGDKIDEFFFYKEVMEELGVEDEIGS